MAKITISAPAVLVLCVLLFAGTASAKRPVVVDPGHGGYDAGLIVNKHKEKDLVLTISKAIEARLVKAGVPVFLTRSVDRHLSISDRVKRTNRRDPLVFLSIHVSSSEGFAVYVSWYPDHELTTREYYSLSSRQMSFLDHSRGFATLMEEALKAAFQMDIFHREMPLPVLSSIGAPAVMIEIPSFKFLDYTDRQVIQRIATAVANGILIYGAY